MNWFDRQISKIRELQSDPHRKEREDGTNFGWNAPIGSILEAYSKITRVVVASPSSFHITTNNRRYVAEECREAAHYLLRAAHLLEANAGFPVDEED